MKRNAKWRQRAGKRSRNRNGEWGTETEETEEIEETEESRGTSLTGAMRTRKPNPEGLGQACHPAAGPSEILHF